MEAKKHSKATSKVEKRSETQLVDGQSAFKDSRDLLEHLRQMVGYLQGYDAASSGGMSESARSRAMQEIRATLRELRRSSDANELVGR